MQSNFWFPGGAVHFTEQTDQPRPTVFRKWGASCINGVNVILQKYGEGRGRGGRTSPQQLKFYFDSSLFVFLSSPFLCSFSFSSLFKGTSLLWMEHRFTLPVCVCLTHIYCTIFFFFTGREKFSRPLQKAYCVVTVSYTHLRAHET